MNIIKHDGKAPEASFTKKRKTCTCLQKHCQERKGRQGLPLSFSWMHSWEDREEKAVHGTQAMLRAHRLSRTLIPKGWIEALRELCDVCCIIVPNYRCTESRKNRQCARLLEEVIERTGPPADLRAGPRQSEFSSPPPLSLECIVCPLHPQPEPFQDYDLERVRCCWEHLD